MRRTEKKNKNKKSHAKQGVASITFYTEDNTDNIILSVVATFCE